MLAKWNRQKWVRERWEGTILMLTNRPATEAISDDDREVLHASLVATMSLYSKGHCMTKAILRLVFFAKRVLADKRLYEDIKALEYLVMAHTIYKKWNINKEVKERLIAHNLQMAQLYINASKDKQACNPFAPGQILGRCEDE